MARFTLPSFLAGLNGRQRTNRPNRARRRGAAGEKVLNLLRHWASPRWGCGRLALLQSPFCQILGTSAAGIPIPVLRPAPFIARRPT
jgi:hypothetical protein